MMADLRRSSRRVKKPTYRAGQWVELTRDNAVYTARLVRAEGGDDDVDNATERSWIVALDEGGGGSESNLVAVTEGSLGVIVSQPPGVNSNAYQTTAKTDAINKVWKKKATTSSPQPPTAHNSSPAPVSTGSSAKKTVHFNDNDDNEDMASSSLSDASKKAALASAREARRRRRQQHGGGDVEAPLSLLIPPPPSGGGRPTKKKKVEDKNVVRIPMLTGTLILYKGETPRRAEFVRKV